MTEMPDSTLSSAAPATDAPLDELLERGRRLFASGDDAGAEDAYRKAANAGSAEAALALASHLVAQGKLNEAEEAFRLADAAGDPDGLSNAGVLRERLGDQSGAEAAWRSAVERGSVLGALNLGALLEYRGDVIGARAAYAQAGPDGEQHVKRLDERRRRTLVPGDRGGDVRHLQAWLRELGHRVEPDGFYEDETQEAVRSFQERRTLDADGIVGPRTWAELEVTPSVRGAVDGLSGEVTAAALAGELLRRHPEYGEKLAGALELDREAGARLPAADWLRRVREQFDPVIAPRLHGRVVIAGLARMDKDLRAQLEPSGFIPALEAEIYPPLDSPPAPSAEALAGYVTDAVTPGRRLVDRLGVEPEANALAAVLIARDVRPPLSVGLFGDWGTGKSFFMGLMQQRIDELTALTREHEEDSAYCGHVRQITFNAWHYADANLWASLVTRVFEGLAESGEDRTKLIGALKTTQRQRELAEARVAAAKSGREEAERKLVATQTATGVARDPAMGDAVIQVAGKLDQDATSATAEFIQTAGSLRRLGTQVRVLWRELRGRYGKGRVRAAAAAAFVALVAIIVIAIAQPPLLALVLGWLGVVGGALRGPAKAVRQAEVIVSDSLDEVQTRLKAEEEAARREHEAAAQAEREANEELDEISSGRQLLRFIAERASTSEYRARLGLIAAVREDFEHLTGLLAGNGARSPKGFPRIERVILYIDDLDRCPADRVVEVLEAVHLLLAFELFVVVVGVDSRWLLNSLRRHYAAQLAGPTEDTGVSVDDAAHWASTPQSYLEKIFQIPYVLRRMDNTGFGRLVASLLAPPADEPARESAAAATPAAPAAVPPEGERDGAGEDAARGATEPTDALAHATGNGAGPPPRIDLRPAALRFTKAEVEFLAGLRELVTTPRAVKRLANTYRLVRAGLSGPHLERFTGEDGGQGEYREVQLMLAALARSSGVGALLLRRITELPEHANWDALADSLTAPDEPLLVATGREEWESFASALVAVGAGDKSKPSVDHMKAWLPKVARFSFLAGFAHN